MQTIICMKWGDRYPIDYANRLWSMIERHTRRPTRLVCYTDDPVDLNEAVESHPLPPITLPDRVANRPWRKMSLWAPTLAGVQGDVLFLDLDIVITNGIDDFFDFKPECTFCVIENWTQLGSDIGNTSVYRFRVGAHPYLYDEFHKNTDRILDRFSNSQTFISRTIREKEFWPAPWCQSFKHTLMPDWPMNFVRPAILPPSTKVVAFTGKPDPDEARDGRWAAPWYKKVYKYVRPTPWIAEHWR